MMYDDFISRMLSKIKSLHSFAIDTAKRKQQNAERFKPDVAEKENTGFELALQERLTETLVKIKADYEEAITKVKSEHMLSGGAIEPDIQLLSSPFPTLDQETIAQLIDKHRYNETMLAALRGYAEENKINIVGSDVPHKEDKLKAWKTIMEGACDLATRVAVDPLTDFTRMAVETFMSTNVSDELRRIVAGVSVDKQREADQKAFEAEHKSTNATAGVPSFFSHAK